MYPNGWGYMSPLRRSWVRITLILMTVPLFIYEVTMHFLFILYWHLFSTINYSYRWHMKQELAPIVGKMNIALHATIYNHLYYFSLSRTHD